jgi:hypothetical protein
LIPRSRDPRNKTANQRFEEGMMKKKYRITSSCPRCGCSGVSHLSEEEIKKKYGDVPNIELECHECMMVMDAHVEEETPSDE